MRVAILGAGLMGYWHGRSARRQGAKVVAVYDPMPERAKKLAARLNSRESLGVDSLFEDKTLNAVHICSPLHTHEPLARRALGAGLHALIEKPAAPTLSETQVLANMAKEKGLLICPVHQLVCQRSVLLARRNLSRIGDLRTVEFRVVSKGGEGRSSAELDALVGDILPHPISVIRELWPGKNPLSDFALQHRQHGQVAVMAPLGNADLTICISTHARPPIFEMVLRGTAGTIHVDFFHDFAVFHPGGSSRWHKLIQPLASSGRVALRSGVNLFGRAIRQEAAYPGLNALIGCFYASIRSGRPAPISLEDTVCVAQAREAIMACFKTGAPIQAITLQASVGARAWH